MTTAIRPGRHGTRRLAGRGPGAALAAVVAGGIVVLALLWCYYRLSWTVPATSDGAAVALQAQDMLRGNWLLHGWTIGDVSFYTTELPEYMLIELVRPLGPGVIHLAAAVTYTLLVLLAAALAMSGQYKQRLHQHNVAAGSRGVRGVVPPGIIAAGSRGVRGVVLSGIIAAGIMLAPQLGYGAFVLLLSPDHTGTEVPLLLGWLLLDLAPRRWWVPALLGLLLAWVQFADRAAVLTAVVPLTVVCLMLAGRARAAGGAGRSRRLAVWRERWFELSLAAAAVASAAVSWLAARLLTAAGGFTAHPLPLTLSPPRLWWTHTRLTGWGILELYGANFTGVSGWIRVSFAALHLVGLALGAAGCALALRRLGRHVFRWRVAPTPADDRTDKDGADDRTDRGEADGERDENAVLVDSVLAVAIVCNLLSYILSIEPGTVPGTGYNAREIAAVLPLGAVLAGRLIGPRLAARLGRPGLAVWAGRRRRAGGRAGDGLAGGESARPRSGYLALGVAAVLCYGAALGYGAAQPAAAGPDASLAGWLAAHHLRYGLAGPEGNVITVDSGGRVRLAFAATGGGRVAGRLYQSERSWYDPRLHDATFVISSVPPGTAAYLPGLIAATDARRTFGPPARVYHFHGYTVMTWNANLLKRLRRPM